MYTTTEYSVVHRACVCVGYEVHKKLDLEDQILAHCIFLKTNIYTETQPVHHTREGEREREGDICVNLIQMASNLIFLSVDETK